MIIIIIIITPFCTLLEFTSYLDCSISFYFVFNPLLPLISSLSSPLLTSSSFSPPLLFPSLRQLSLISSSHHSSAAVQLSVEEFEESKVLLNRMALCSWGQVSPVCALLGGVLGQEILKAVSG